MHEHVILSSGTAWLSVDISLKPLLTPDSDKWTYLSRKMHILHILLHTAAY